MSDQTIPAPDPAVVERVATHPFEVVRTPASAWNAEHVEIRVHWGGTSFPSRVSISGPRHRFGAAELSPAEVDWSAIGSVSPADATLYATAILMAAQIAPTLKPATGPED